MGLKTGLRSQRGDLSRSGVDPIMLFDVWIIFESIRIDLYGNVPRDLRDHDTGGPCSAGAQSEADRSGDCSHIAPDVIGDAWDLKHVVHCGFCVCCYNGIFLR